MKPRKLTPQQQRTIDFYKSLAQGERRSDLNDWGWHGYTTDSDMKRHIARLVKRGLLEDSGYHQARYIGK